MKGKRLFKFGLMLVLVCLVLGMASMAMAAMDITSIGAQDGEPLVDVSGNVKLKIGLGGVVNGDQLTIKVEDYDDVLSNSASTTRIKYIDQITVSGSGAVNVDVPSFKLKDATSGTSKTYLVTVGGTGVNAPTVQAIYKLSDQTVTFTPAKAWIVGPTVVNAGVPYTYELKVVNAEGRLGAAGDGWSVNHGSISGNVITVTFDSQGTYTLNPTKAGVTVTPLNNIMVVMGGAETPYITSDSITNADTGVKIGDRPVVSKLPSGAFVDRTPIASGGTPVIIQVPAAPGTATNTVKVGLVGQASLTPVANNSFTPNTPGKYRMVIETAAGEITTTKTVYFAVLSSEDIANVTTRANLTADVVAVNTDGGNIALTFDRKADNTYDFWILPMTGRIVAGSEYSNTAADKAHWAKLTGVDSGETFTFAKPAQDKDYRISIYAKHSATVANVDAYRIITLRINADGSVQRLNPDVPGTWIAVNPL